MAADPLINRVEINQNTDKERNFEVAADLYYVDVEKQ